MSKAQEIVNEQAEDEALWFIAVGVSEAYLQQALRRLHRAVEDDSGPQEDADLDDALHGRDL